MNLSNELHVIFGTGPVGLATMDALLARGKRVRMVNRSGRATLPDGVELIYGDAADVTFARQASDGAAVIYQALNPPYSQWPELFPPLQKSVLTAAMQTGAKLITLENVYMYGATGGQNMVETMAYAAQTKKGRVRARMAEELMEAHASGKVRMAIGRASDFFGPRVLVSAMGERVFPAALAGKTVQVMGDPDLLHTYTYAPDIGEALAILGEEDVALGQVWHIPSPETVTTRAFIQMIFEESGHPPKIQAAPKIILRGLALFNADLREALEMIYQFEEPFVLDASKFQKTFGMQATPLPEAIRATVAWYREHTPAD